MKTKRSKSEKTSKQSKSEKTSKQSNPKKRRSGSKSEKTSKQSKSEKRKKDLPYIGLVLRKSLQTVLELVRNPGVLNRLLQLQELLVPLQVVRSKILG